MNKYLPIGSVCSIKDFNMDVMIVGYCFKKGNIKYDYIGVTHPAGLITEKNFVGFDIENIEKVLFKGYETEKSNSFIENLEKKLNEIGNADENLSLEDLLKKVIEINKGE